MHRFYVLLFATLISVGGLYSLSHSDASAMPLRSSKALDREPPAAVYEVSPPERHGFIWAPGCWKWDNKQRLVWSSGHWLAKRPGYVWVPDGWEQRADKWYFAEGYWENDGSVPVVVAEPDPLPPADEIVETPATVVAKTASAKAKVKKHVVKPQLDYSDQTIWIHRRP